MNSLDADVDWIACPLLQDHHLPFLQAREQQVGLDADAVTQRVTLLLAVGGGSFLVPDDMPGASAVIRVEHHAVANAVGAAIAQVSGEVDRIFTGIGRDQAIKYAQTEATQRALDAGADPASVVVLDVEDIPIAYLPGDARRVRVRVIADIANFGANCHVSGQRVGSPDFQVVAPLEGQAPSSVPIRADV